VILVYHKVDIIAPTMWWVTPADLDRQLSELRTRTFVYLDDYVAAEGHVAVTFDDAYENVARHALPVLRAHGIRFEVFVIGDRLADWNDFDSAEPSTRHMARADLAEVVGSRGRLQWHTRTHPDLRDLAEDQIAYEMTLPASLREEYPVPHFTWFAYPYGEQDARSVEMAGRRFSGAVSVGAGLADDRRQLNRVTVTSNTSFSGAALGGDYKSTSAAQANRLQ
jgi:peptidoglycan/xylan/chitin deacetylase (PgdA/CDA1 family)